MFNPNKYVFICTDFSYIFAAGSSADDKKKNDPMFVKLFGFALDYNFEPISCYIYEEFGRFGKSKDNLVSEIKNHPILKGTGVINSDKNYQHRLNLDNLNFVGSYDFKDIVDFD